MEMSERTLMMSLCIGLSISFGAAATTSEGEPPALIERSIFFGNPDRAGVQISPNGEYLSFLAPHDGVMNVWVQPVSGDESQARPVTKATDRPISSYFWAHNSEQIIYPQDQGGNENFHLYSVNIENGSE